MGQHKKNLIKK